MACLEVREASVVSVIVPAQVSVEVAAREGDEVLMVLWALGLTDRVAQEMAVTAAQVRPLLLSKGSSQLLVAEAEMGLEEVRAVAALGLGEDWLERSTRDLPCRPVTVETWAVMLRRSVRSTLRLESTCARGRAGSSSRGSSRR